MRSVVIYVLALMSVLCSCAGEERLREGAESGAATSVDDSFHSVALVGLVQEFRWQPSGNTPVPGVRVCQHEPRRCTETSELGRWMLDALEPEREILLTFEKAGYVTLYQAMVTPRFSSTVNGVGITPTDVYDEVSEAIGLATLEESKGLGSVAFGAYVVLEGSVLDHTVHVRLHPDAGTGPIYALAPDFALSTVIPDGGSAIWGFFRDLPPRDDYELEFTMDDGECAQVPHEYGGWPAADGRPNVVRVAVGADAITWYTTQRCVRNEKPPPSE